MALIKCADQIYLGGRKGLFVLYFQDSATHEEKSVQELIKHEPEAENIDQCCLYVCMYVLMCVSIYMCVCMLIILLSVCVCVCVCVFECIDRLIEIDRQVDSLVFN